MHNNVVEAICDVAVENGIAALRFNFRGAGPAKANTITESASKTTCARHWPTCKHVPEIDS